MTRILLTGGINKLLVELSGEQRVGEVPEELLRKSCNAVDIMVKVLRVCEVDLR